MPWIPKYTKLKQEKRDREIIRNDEWNRLFNELSEQGNHNSITLDDIINKGNFSVQNSLLASNSLKLGGELPNFYASRSNVLGIDEDVFRPGGSFVPTSPVHPANKRYVDRIFEEFVIRYNNGVVIQGRYPNYSQFIAAHPTGRPGEAYLVGTNIYIWDHLQNVWYDTGSLRGDKGDKGDKGNGVIPGGAIGDYLVKLGTGDYSMGWKRVDLTRAVFSDQSRNITVSATAPVGAVNGDLWFKV